MVRISFLTLGTRHHTQITSSSFTHLDRSHDAVSEDRQFSSDGPHPLLKLGHVGRGGQHAREVVVSCTRSGADGGLSLLVTAATAARPVLGAQRLRKTTWIPALPASHGAPAAGSEPGCERRPHHAAFAASCGTARARRGGARSGKHVGSALAPPPSTLRASPGAPHPLWPVSSRRLPPGLTGKCSVNGRGRTSVAYVPGTPSPPSIPPGRPLPGPV